MSKKCEVCGRPLCSYNPGKICFSHSVRDPKQNKDWSPIDDMQGRMTDVLIGWQPAESELSSKK
jgi:hypothetical protein